MMHQVINAYLFGAGGASEDSSLGALLYTSGIVSDVAYEAAIAFDTEAYDGGYHTSGSNTRITIPSGVTRGRLTINAQNNNSTKLEVATRKAGSSHAGRARAEAQTSGANTANAASAILSVTASDYFEMVHELNAIGIDFQPGPTWFAFEPISSTLKGCLVQKSSDQALSAGATVTLTWDTEVYDTDAFHSSSGSTLTVPSGVSLVRVSGQITQTGIGAGQGVLSFLKNGASARGLPQKDLEASSPCINCVSAILAVSPGDTFEAQAFGTNANNVKSADETWFQIEEVPAATKYAVVYKSASQSIPGSTFTAVEFGAELADTDGFHDNSTNNTRLTVPSGCTKARLSFNIRTPSSSAQMIGRVAKNGTDSLPGMPYQEVDTAGTDNLGGMGAWVDVVPGDYFELQFFQSGGTMSLADSDNLWFCIEAK